MAIRARGTVSTGEDQQSAWSTYFSTPAGRGFVLLALMSACFMGAMSMQENIVTNYFEDVLKLQGPQFGYITAIREIPGFLMIFLSALAFKLSIQRLTALALILLTVGYLLFGISNSFWTVAPWVILSSMGYHTVLQTQYALGLSLTRESHSGRILGRIGAIGNAGSLVTMVFVLLAFQYDWLSFRAAFVVAGVLAFLGAVAIFTFPSLRDGQTEQHVARRERIVFNMSYRYYYLLALLDGGRQQIFFSFGLWVLVHRYHLSVPEIAALLIAVRAGSIVASPYIGRLVDERGERTMLGFVNVAYFIALAGYAIIDNVWVASSLYMLYSFIMPFSSIGSTTYLRKVAVHHEIPPSLAMGVTLQHAAAIVVPVSTGFILNFVGYQVPFMIACGFAILSFSVTRRLNPAGQKSPARIEQDRAMAAAEAA